MSSESTRSSDDHFARPEALAEVPASGPSASEQPAVSWRTSSQRVVRSSAASGAGDAEVLHSWLGVVGPRPTILSLVSVAMIASIFAHLVFDLPSWWPFAAGAAAIVFNAGLAYWQAGSFRVVAVTANGIQVLRKARWSSECTHLLGTMPRMPLGPFEGRWCQLSIANTMLWVHQKYHPMVAAFDAEYRALFNGLDDSNASGSSHPVLLVAEGAGTAEPAASGERELNVWGDRV